MKKTRVKQQKGLKSVACVRSTAKWPKGVYLVESETLVVHGKHKPYVNVVDDFDNATGAKMGFVDDLRTLEELPESENLILIDGVLCYADVLREVSKVWSVRWTTTKTKVSFGSYGMQSLIVGVLKDGTRAALVTPVTFSAGEKIPPPLEKVLRGNGA